MGVANSSIKVCGSDSSHAISNALGTSGTTCPTNMPTIQPRKLSKYHTVHAKWKKNKHIKSYSMQNNNSGILFMCISTYNYISMYKQFLCE